MLFIILVIVCSKLITCAYVAALLRRRFFIPCLCLFRVRHLDAVRVPRRRAAQAAAAQAAAAAQGNRLLFPRVFLFLL